MEILMNYKGDKNNMKIAIDKMGVYILMSHLIITLAIIAVYCYTLSFGQGDDTLKTILTVIVGYWFGSMGVSSIKTKPVKKEDGENEG